MYPLSLSFSQCSGFSAVVKMILATGLSRRRFLHPFPVAIELPLCELEALSQPPPLPSPVSGWAPLLFDFG
jgi:hypothetical protein